VRLLAAAPSRLLILETALEAGFRMLDLAERYRLTARRIHDARHAATALMAGVRRVYTYDLDDWRVFAPEGIFIAGPPSALVAGS
jgi:predicted nucleic acid-binding protein